MFSEALQISVVAKFFMPSPTQPYQLHDATGEKKLNNSPMDVYKLEPDPKAVSYKNIGDEPASWLRFELKQGYS